MKSVANHFRTWAAARTVVVATAVSTFFIASASAQTYRAMPPDPYDPHAATQPNHGAVQQPVGVPVGLPQAVTESLGNSIDYPATEVRTVPIAKAQQVGARTQMDRARRDLSGVIDTLKEDFEYSAEYVQVSSDVKAAQEEYDRARGHVLNQLYQDPQYTALVRLRDTMATKLEQLRARRAPRSEILAAAAVKLDYATQLSDREATALASDSSVQDARRRLTDAGQRAGEMRSRFARGLRREQAFADARRNLEDAKANFLVADAFLGASINARDIALDYAAWIHRWDVYKYLHSPYGYGYGGYGYRGYGAGCYYPGYPLAGAGFAGTGLIMQTR
jgi:hypothetical protein